MAGRRYYISFDTNEIPGGLKAVTVDLDTEIIKDMDRGLPINLCDDPLYPALVQYVRANPARDKLSGAR